MPETLTAPIGEKPGTSGIFKQLFQEIGSEPGAAKTTESIIAPAEPLPAPPQEPVAPTEPTPPREPARPREPRKPAEPKPAVDDPVEAKPTIKLVMPPEALLKPKDAAAHEDFPEEAPEGTSEKGKAAWKAMRTALKEYKAKASTVPAGDPAAQARIAELEATIQQLSPIVERASIESHPQFIRDFEEPKKNLLSEAANVMGMAGLDANQFEKALQSRGKARYEALDELSESITSPSLRDRITQIGVELERLDEKRDGVIKNSKMWKEQADANLAAESHRQREQEKQFWSKQVDATVDVLANSFEFFRKTEGNEDWNKQVDQRIAQTKYLLNENTDPQQTVAAAALATMAPGYRAWALSEREARIKAENELAEYKSGQSSLGDGKSDPPKPGEKTSSQIFSKLYSELEQKTRFGP